MPAGHSGSVASFEELMRRFQAPVLHFLRHRGGTADAEDLLQETFIRVYTGLGRYRGPWRFATWLFTIARRVSINHHRRTRAAPARYDGEAIHEAVSADLGPAETAARGDGRRYLWARAAEVLSEAQWTALWLHYVEDMPTRQVAAVLGCSRVAVKTMIFRARKKLMPLVHELGPEEKGDRPHLCDDHASTVPASGPFRQMGPVPFSGTRQPWRCPMSESDRSRGEQPLMGILRREATDSRPEFSESLHARLRAALPRRTGQGRLRLVGLRKPGQASDRSAAEVPVCLSHPTHVPSRRWALAAAAAMVLLAAILVGGWIGRSRTQGLPAEPAVVEANLPSAAPEDAGLDLDEASALAGQAIEELDGLVDATLADQSWAGLDEDARAALSALADHLPQELASALAWSEPSNP